METPRSPARGLRSPNPAPSAGWADIRPAISPPTARDLYVAIGSNGNINPNDDPWRAAVSKVVNGKLVQFGTGLRNPVGITFYPGTDDLYVVVNERDGEGDELVPDYLTRVQQGDFFGWPYAYIGNHE